ncbi:MAG: RecX family transcriptional regulator [Spirochaetales bacterium]|nr:RecX family transcriptional regulator [Spirochaetales bacterium]
MVRRKQEEDFSSQRDNLSILVISQGNYPNSLKIELSDSSIFFVSDSFWFERHLGIGCFIDDELLKLITCEDEFVRCYAKSLDLISYREHGREELSRKLKLRGFSNSIERVLDLLVEYNYIDDSRYAELLVEELIRKNKSKQYIFSKLMSRGLDFSTIKETLDVRYTSEIAKQIVEDVIFTISLKKTLKKDELLRILVNRGFEYYLINDIIKKNVDI